MDITNHDYISHEKRQLCMNKISQLIAYIADRKHVDAAQLKCAYVCLNSNMFRGYLHPSPVIDLIVGNIRRGSMRKGEVRSKNCLIDICLMQMTV